MKAQELLEKYPKVTKLIKTWWIERMKAALDTEDLSEEFKLEMKLDDLSVENIQIARVIDGNPHSLYEFFDKRGVHIRYDFTDDYHFHGCSINENLMYYKFKSRREAERDVLDDAFLLLEKTL